MYYMRKQKSKDYLEYQNEIRDTVQISDDGNFDWPFSDRLVSFTIRAGLSNRGADLDNVLKPLLDTYQQMYEQFNDNKVYEINASKEIVKKGEEFLTVHIEEYVSDPDHDT